MLLSVYSVTVIGCCQEVDKTGNCFGWANRRWTVVVLTECSCNCCISRTVKKDSHNYGGRFRFWLHNRAHHMHTHARTCTHTRVLACELLASSFRYGFYLGFLCFFLHFNKICLRLGVEVLSVPTANANQILCGITEICKIYAQNLLRMLLSNFGHSR